MECGFAFEGCDFDVDGVDLSFELEGRIVVVADRRAAVGPDVEFSVGEEDSSLEHVHLTGAGLPRRRLRT